VPFANAGGMTPKELKARTKKSALEIIKLARSLPTDTVTGVLIRQIVKWNVGWCELPIVVPCEI
jgi:hypothetical protein